MKKYGFNPFVLLTGEGDDDPPTVIGGGTGQGGSDPIEASPCSYNFWLTSDWADDYIQNGVIDENDFAAWWESNGFSKEDWEELNPDLDWDDYFD